MMNNKVTRIIANSVGLAAVAALGITDSAETEESDQPTDQETQDENRGEEE